MLMFQNPAPYHQRSLALRTDTTKVGTVHNDLLRTSTSDHGYQATIQRTSQTDAGAEPALTTGSPDARSTGTVLF